MPHGHVEQLERGSATLAARRQLAQELERGSATLLDARPAQLQALEMGSVMELDLIAVLLPKRFWPPQP